MAKRRPPRRQVREQRDTNWILIGGVVAVAVIGLFALLLLSLQEPLVPAENPEPQASLVVQDFCEANEEACLEHGVPEAPVTVVEVSDYGCPHCRNFNLDELPTFEANYIDEGLVEWVVLPYALSDRTAPAAEASLCAAEQDSFFEFHHMMFEIQDSDLALTEEGFLTAAEQLDLDTGAFNACLESGRFASVVNENVSIASRAGVSATPTFFVNGNIVEGNRAAALEQEILAALETE
ncbi:MAG: thioredoxin domain-containing protein [Candidatus Promineifilaceae bacterium]|nr:thioredoxin domain-containing protein [Candidatus Promineifilaceae bacterium]